MSRIEKNPVSTSRAEVKMRREKEKLLFERNVPIREIAKKYGVSERIVYEDRRKIEKQTGVIFERRNTADWKKLPVKVLEKKVASQLREMKGVNKYTPLELSVKLKCPIQIINKELDALRNQRRLRNKKPSNPTPQTLDRWQRALELRNKGWGDAQIVQDLGCWTVNTLNIQWQRMRAYGLTVESRKRMRRLTRNKSGVNPTPITLDRWQKALELRNKGLGDKQIAEELGYWTARTLNVEWQRMRRYGLTVEARSSKKRDN